MSIMTISSSHLRRAFDAWSGTDGRLEEKEFEHVVLNVLDLALTEDEVARVRVRVGQSFVPFLLSCRRVRGGATCSGG